MRVNDLQAYRKMDVTRERISRILELREILLSIQIGFSLVNAAVACEHVCEHVCSTVQQDCEHVCSTVQKFDTIDGTVWRRHPFCLISFHFAE